MLRGLECKRSQTLKSSRCKCDSSASALREREASASKRVEAIVRAIGTLPALRRNPDFGLIIPKVRPRGAVSGSQNDDSRNRESGWRQVEVWRQFDVGEGSTFGTSLVGTGYLEKYKMVLCPATRHGRD